MSIGDVLCEIYEHYERHEAVYKLLVFPLAWILGLYAAGWIFLRLLAMILSALGS